jgi:hypothetical protein
LAAPQALPFAQQWACHIQFVLRAASVGKLPAIATIAKDSFIFSTME